MSPPLHESDGRSALEREDSILTLNSLVETPANVSSIMRKSSVNKDEISHVTTEFEIVIKHRPSVPERDSSGSYDSLPQVIATNSTDSEDSTSFQEDDGEIDESILLSLRPIPFRIYPSKPCLRTSKKNKALRNAPKVRKSVSYNSITVHYHAVSLGDCPSVSKGLPLAMTWERLGTESFKSLDEYEEERPELRGKKKIRLRAARREKILLRAGITHSQMRRCLETIEKLKKEQDANDVDASSSFSSGSDSSSSSSHTYYKPSSMGGMVFFGADQQENKSSATKKPTTPRRKTPSGALELFWFDWICSSSLTYKVEDGR